MSRRTHASFNHATPADITPREVYENRRAFLKSAALGAAGLTLAGCGAGDVAAQTATPGKLARLASVRSDVAGAMTLDKLTPYELVTTYNNFYEFGTDKEEPAQRAGTLKTRPWTISVEGAVAKPKVFDIEDLLKLAPMEERIYRLRCVEGWSMVIPWVGYSLSQLIRKVEPTGNAKFVEFVTLADSKQMPGLNPRILTWPYAEGLRIDEANHCRLPGKLAGDHLRGMRVGQRQPGRVEPPGERRVAGADVGGKRLRAGVGLPG